MKLVGVQEQAFDREGCKNIKWKLLKKIRMYSKIAPCLVRRFSPLCLRLLDKGIGISNNVSNFC